MSKINIYGQLDAQTVDQKLAVTKQIYDENFSQFQSELNKTFAKTADINAALDPVKTSIDEINTKISWKTIE